MLKSNRVIVLIVMKNLFQEQNSNFRIFFNIQECLV